MIQTNETKYTAQMYNELLRRKDALEQHNAQLISERDGVFAQLAAAEGTTPEALAESIKLTEITNDGLVQNLRFERDLLRETCDQLEQIVNARQADNARLREALRPFAEALPYYNATEYGHVWSDGMPVAKGITVGDLRRAAEAMKGGQT